MKYIKILSIVCLSLLVNDSYAIKLKDKNNTSSNPTAQHLNTIQPSTNTNSNLTSQHINTIQSSPNSNLTSPHINTIQANTNSIQLNTQVNSLLNDLFQIINSQQSNNNFKDGKNSEHNEKNKKIADYFKKCNTNEKQEIKNCFEEYKKCISGSNQILSEIQELKKQLDEDNIEVFLKGGKDAIIKFMSDLNDKNEEFINHKNKGLQALKKISSIYNFANKREEILNINDNKNLKIFDKIKKKFDMLENYYNSIEHIIQTQNTIFPIKDIDNICNSLDSLSKNNLKQEDEKEDNLKQANEQEEGPEEVNEEEE